VDAALRGLTPKLEGTTIHVTGGLNRPPMPENALMKSTFARAKEIAASIGMDIHASGTGGGSDGNFVAPLGVPVLDGVGAYGEGIHSDREYIFNKSLPERAALVAELIKQW
jgi:glutamate carboxypeptidase